MLDLFPSIQKGLLHFTSALGNALQRSCTHQAEASFCSQVERLKEAGFPCDLILAVGKKLLVESRTKKTTCERGKGDKMAVLPYVHNAGHRIKKAKEKVGVPVVFSAPNKLHKLCKRVNTEENRHAGCRKRHEKRFFNCQACVVYETPLSSG